MLNYYKEMNFDSLVLYICGLRDTSEIGMRVVSEHDKPTLNPPIYSGYGYKILEKNGYEVGC